MPLQLSGISAEHPVSPPPVTDTSQHANLLRCSGNQCSASGFARQHCFASLGVHVPEPPADHQFHPVIPNAAAFVSIKLRCHGNSAVHTLHAFVSERLFKFDLFECSDLLQEHLMGKSP